MINACVSHELRNPLNAIIAINIEKAILYKELEKAFKNPQIDKDACLNIIEKLLENHQQQIPRTGIIWSNFWHML